MAGIAAADCEAPSVGSESERSEYRTTCSLVALNRKELVKLVGAKCGAYGSAACDVAFVGKLVFVVYEVVHRHRLVEEVATNEVCMKICKQVSSKHFVEIVPGMYVEKFQCQRPGFAEEFIVVFRRTNKLIHTSAHLHVAFAQYGHLTFDERDGCSRIVGEVELRQQTGVAAKKLRIAPQELDDILVGQADGFFFRDHAKCSHEVFTGVRAHR